MFRNTLSELQKSDIELLCKSEVIENRMLDCKRELPGNKDDGGRGDMQ